MKKKGISLIVLIITIVVIIILATAIIVNIAKTNIINNAKEATVKQDIKALQEELTMYIADEYADTLGNFKVEKFNVTNKNKLLEVLPSLKGSKYEGFIVIENGKVMVTEKMSEPEKTWAMETLGITEASIKVPSDNNMVEIGTIVEDANATINGGDFKYSNPVIPVGFRAVETEVATWNDTDSDGNPDGWNEGLVIEDSNNNQFVWVPIDGTNLSYARWIAVQDSSWTNGDHPLPEGIESEQTQITKYQGFYIARYEAGIPDGTETASDELGIPVVKKDVKVWTSISGGNAKINAESMYTTEYVKSGLITGTGWDTVCKWIENAGISVTNSKSYGNNNCAVAPANVTGCGTQQKTGFSDYWRVKNIYDLAGNAAEIINEKITSSGGFSTCGGYHWSSGEFKVVSKVNLGTNREIVGFRVMLYVM